MIDQQQQRFVVFFFCKKFFFSHFQNDKTVKLISQEEMETIRKAANQSQPVTGKKLSVNDDDDDDDEDTNKISKSQADKGKYF